MGASNPSSHMGAIRLEFVAEIRAGARSSGVIWNLLSAHRSSEAASAFGQGGRAISADHLQPHGEQLHCPGAQEHESPQWHGPALFRLAFLRFLSCLRFDFIVIDS